MPEVGRVVMPFITDCTVPDVQNGEVQMLALQRVDKSKCMLLPAGFALTNTQMTIVLAVVLGVGMTVQLNLFYWFLYRNEFEVIEQFKIEKDQKWPWNKDKEEWRKIVRKSLALVLFNNTVVNVSMFCLYSSFFNWQLPWNHHAD